MRILLISPPNENTVQEYPDDSGDGFVELEDYGYFPPLGLLYILSYAERELPQHEYFFHDCVGEHLKAADLPAIFQKIKPDVVGITSFTISLVDVLNVAKIARKECPDVHLCLGGHHPTAFPYEACKLNPFDSVVVGEGEYAFTDLLKCIEKGEDFTQILGVYTEESIELFKEKQFKDRRFLNHLIVPPAYVEDVDDIPMPSRKYIQHINYNSVVGVTGQLATLITSRGCPYKCTFCDVPYKKYRQHDIEMVMDEIEVCLELGYKEFHFYDDLFNITEKKLLDFCAAIQNRNLKIIWNFRGRVNAVTYDSLKAAKEAGLRMASFGVETGSDIGMKTLKKGTKIDQVQKTFDWCHDLGIKTIANFMIGLPHEKSEKDVMDNIQFLINLNPDYAQVNILNLYPHTKVFDDAIALGIAEAGRWEAFSLDPKPGFKVDHWTESLSEKDLVRLHRASYHKFYFRPKYILKSLLKTSSMHEFSSKIKGARKLLGV